MDKFFIREIATVWAFNKNNEAVWKCGNVGKLKITQDGNTIRKKDALGATIFKMDTAKSANISFEVNYWDFNILSMVAGAEKRELNGSENPYLVKPISVPCAQTKQITATDIANGYIELDKRPRQTDFYYYEIAVHKVDSGDGIVKAYQQSNYADNSHFYVVGRQLMLPTSLMQGDNIEIVYEYESYRGTELINSANNVPETWKVRILMLVSPICNTDIMSAVWLTARNATPDMQLTLDFGIEENIPISLELGYSLCDTEKNLYEIVSAGVLPEGVELRTNDNQILYTHDQQPVRTIQ